MLIRMEMVCDRIVFGIHSLKVREKLLSVGSQLTLDKATDFSRFHELALAQMRNIKNSKTSGTGEQVVHVVHRRQHIAKEV